MRTFAETQPFAGEPDAELAKKVHLYLSSNRPGFRQFDTGAKGGTVTLSGSVPSFFLRQLAVAAAKHVTGVRRVVDEMEVVFATVHHCLVCGRIECLEPKAVPPPCCS